MATSAFLPAPVFALTAMPPLPKRPAPPVRRPSPGQGQALSKLAHAIEYLIDSRIPLGGNSTAEHEAVRLLMRLSREVFEECPARLPLTTRVTGWLSHRLGTSEA